MGKFKSLINNSKTSNKSAGRTSAEGNEIPDGRKYLWISGWIHKNFKFS